MICRPSVGASVPTLELNGWNRHLVLEVAKQSVGSYGDRGARTHGPIRPILRIFSLHR
jgi:hypothetical protein